MTSETADWIASSSDTSISSFSAISSSISPAFTVFVARVGSYDRVYGSLGAVVVLLLWFYLSAFVTLIGAELNAEMARRAARAGNDAPS